MSPDAEQFVRSAMPTLGWAQRTTGHWTHGLGVTNPRHDGEYKHLIVQSIDKKTRKLNAMGKSLFLDIKFEGIT